MTIKNRNVIALVTRVFVTCCSSIITTIIGRMHSFIYSTHIVNPFIRTSVRLFDSPLKRTTIQKTCFHYQQPWLMFNETE